MALTSRAFLDVAADQPPHVKLDALEKAADGLIALTGGPGRAARSGARGEGRRIWLRRDARSFLRCSATGSMSNCSVTAGAEEKQVEPGLLELAYANGIALVATNEPFYGRREDFEAHDALICIAEGRLVAESERRQLSAEHYFKSRAEMTALFADLPEALASTVEIAQRCAFRPKTRKPILPRFTGVGTAAPLDENAELRRAGRRGPHRPHRDARSRLGPDHRRLPQAARFRALGDREDEVSGLLPDRRRLHPVGEVARAFRSGRAAARARARSSPRRSPSPTSIRSASACCSSASSIPSACRCRTSTSTSARSGATR